MFKISFEFDETSKQVSNIKVTEIEKPVDNTVYDYELIIEENKLRLLPPAIKKLGVVANDRISVQYISLGTGKSAPVIGKAEVFTDPLDGNRLSGLNTVSFRGEKRSTLIQFGTKFNLEPYKEGMWQLKPVKDRPIEFDDSDISQEENQLAELNPNQLDSELDTLLNSIDDLPFD